MTPDRPMAALPSPSAAPVSLAGGPEPAAGRTSPLNPAPGSFLYSPFLHSPGVHVCKACGFRHKAAVKRCFGCGTENSVSRKP